jgi:hypothetical protein
LSTKLTLFFSTGFPYYTSGFQQTALLIALENGLSQNTLMGKKKGGTSGDRHKPGRMVRIKQALAAQLERLAASNATNLTQEVNRAVRELLAREGYWPPP